MIKMTNALFLKYLNRSLLIIKALDVSQISKILSFTLAV